MGKRLQTTDYRLPTTDYGLRCHANSILPLSCAADLAAGSRHDGGCRHPQARRLVPPQTLDDFRDDVLPSEPLSLGGAAVLPIGTDPWQVRELNGAVRF